MKGRILFAVVLLVVATVCGAGFGRHYLDYGHIPPLGLHADLVERTASIGIPGISKMYEGRLFNFGLPARIQQCDFVSDAMWEKGQMIAYAVQRLDTAKQTWETITEMSGEEFCRPVPLSMVRATPVARLLFPGQFISTNSEASTARDGFRKGDRFRFLLYTRLRLKEDVPAREIPTQEMVITEEVGDPRTNYRILH